MCIYCICFQESAEITVSECLEELRVFRTQKSFTHTHMHAHMLTSLHSRYHGMNYPTYTYKKTYSQSYKTLNLLMCVSLRLNLACISSYFMAKFQILDI